jgi:hypothetical protein
MTETTSILRGNQELAACAAAAITNAGSNVLARTRGRGPLRAWHRATFFRSRSKTLQP